MKAKADADRTRKEAEKLIADVGFALAAAKSKLSFVYGLMGGLALFGVAGMVFMAMRRKLNAGSAQSDSGDAGKRKPAKRKIEFDRLVAAVLNEQQRRDSKATKPSAPVRIPASRGAGARLIVPS